MGPDLRPEAVLEGRDDAAAAGVVLGVGAGDHEQVERQAQRVAAHLDVALLEDVEQADLDALGEVGQLVDREDAAVGARDEPVVDGRLVRQVAALGDLDRVDLADQVGDGDVRRGQLLAVAAVARQPVDRRGVALGGDDLLARVGLTGASGSSLSSPPATTGTRSSSSPTSSRARRVLAWPRSPRKHDVLAGEDGVLDGRDDGVVVADDAREDRLVRREPAQQVGAQLLLDGPRPVAAGAQLAEGLGPGRVGHLMSISWVSFAHRG